MKIGDIHHSNKTVSFNMPNLIREQLESLTSMVYNHLSPKSIKKRRGQNRQNFGDRNTLYSRDRQKQNFRANYRRQPQDRHRCDSKRGSYRHQNYDNRGTSREKGRKTLGETSVMTDMTIEIGVEQEKEV